MARRRYLLAVDQGTTGTHVMVVNDRQEVVGRGLPGVHPALPAARLGGARPAGDLEDGRALLPEGPGGRRRPARDVVRPSASPTSARPPRSGTARPGEPLARAIVWQDRRTADACAELKARGVEPRVRETTGLVLDPYFCATKLRWLLDHVEGAAGAGRDRRALLRHHRLLAGLPAHRRRAARHRRLQRQPHAALRPAQPRVERGDARAVRHPAADPPGGPELRRGLRHDPGHGLAPRRHPGRGDGRRSAGGALRPGLLPARARRSAPTAPAPSS